MSHSDEEYGIAFHQNLFQRGQLKSLKDAGIYKLLGLLNYISHFTLSILGGFLSLIHSFIYLFFL